MALAEKDLEIVTEHIQKEFPILRESSSSELTVLHNNHVLERGRREEERRYQKEILETIIHQMDKRFAEAREETNRRFEETNRRFEETNRRFKETNQQIKESREETNRRFEQMFAYMDKHFKESRDETTRQIKESREDASRQFRYLLWTIGVGLTTITIASKYL